MRVLPVSLVFAALGCASAFFASCAASESAPDAGGIEAGPSDAAVAETTPEDAYEPPPLTSKCSDDSEARGVVLAVDGSTDEIRFLTQKGGKLIDQSLTFAGLENPRRVAVRSDGLEAAIAWGSFGAGYGIAIYSLQKDGTAPKLVKSQKIGNGFLPFGFTYVGDDRLLLALSGGAKHEIVTLDRQASGFTEVARVAAPGAFSYALGGRKAQGDAVLARADLVNDTASSIHLMVPSDGGAFQTSGTVGQTTPPAIDLRVHPNGLFAYSQTDSPEDALTPFHLDATGLLHSVKIEATGVSTLTRQSLPRIGTRLAIDPQGRFIVMQGNVYTQSTGTTPQVNGYRLMTAPLREDGKMGALYPQSAQITALLFDDMQVTPSGHLLISVTLSSIETSLMLFAQPTLGDWEVCAGVPLIGGAHIAMGPP